MKTIIKKILAISLSFCMIFSISTSASALGSHTITNKSIDILDVMNNPEKYPEVEIIIHESIEEYIKTIENDPNLTSENKSRLINNAINSHTTRSNISYGFLTVRDTVVVTSGYSVYPYFYCKMQYSQGSPTPDAIVSIENSDIDRNYNGISKQFDGTLYVNLENYNTIYYDLNGDFYHNGTTDVGAEVSIPVGGAATIAFTASYSTNFYAYKHATSRIRLNI